MFQVDKEMHGPKNPHTVRFPDALFEHLCQLAQNRGVSFNFFVLLCCKYAMEHMEEEKES